MHSFKIYIIFSPFISILFSGALFLFFQSISKRKYFLNLIISFILTIFLTIFLIYKFNFYLDANQTFYIIFIYLCNAFIFMNLVQACVSSIQLTLLKIIYLKPGISKKEILKKYNSNNLFEQRIRRLKSAGIIYKNKSSVYLKNNKILLVLNFFLILKKMFNIKN